MRRLLVVAVVLLAGCSEADTEPAISDREHEICVHVADAKYPDMDLISTWEQIYADCVKRNEFTTN
jgi:hypothetical protein